MKFDIFYKNYFQEELPIFKKWKKDKEVNSLEEVEEYLNIFDNYKRHSGDSYSVLEKIKQNKRSIIYTFRTIPARDSIAVRENLPIEYCQTKIVPEIKLKNKK